MSCLQGGKLDSCLLLSETYVLNLLAMENAELKGCFTVAILFIAAKL